MTQLLRSLFRHFKLNHLAPLLGANLLCVLPLLVALAGPLLLKNNLGAGLAVLMGGFFVAGQLMAVTGRLFLARFRKEKSPGILRAWGSAWSEGLVVSCLFVGLFSLAFQSVPYYLSQDTGFSLFSLITLGLGTLLVLGMAPYFLPARREGLGLGQALARSFRLMNTRPLLALGGLLLSGLFVAASLGTLGLFPGLAGLAALHQGFWDHADPELKKD